MKQRNGIKMADAFGLLTQKGSCIAYKILFMNVVHVLGRSIATIYNLSEETYLDGIYRLWASLP